MIDSPDALKELLPNVSRETIEKLAEFREMILAEDQNLISKNDKNFIWIRHFYDSLRLAQFITSNGNNIIDIDKIDEIFDLNLKQYNREILDQITTEAHYKGYLKKQESEIISLTKEEKVEIPTNLNYELIPSLSTEIVEKLTKIKPKNLSQASRIDGVTPAALSVILSYIKTKAKSQKLA